VICIPLNKLYNWMQNRLCLVVHVVGKLHTFSCCLRNSQECVQCAVWLILDAALPSVNRHLRGALLDLRSNCCNLRKAHRLLYDAGDAFSVSGLNAFNDRFIDDPSTNRWSDRMSASQRAIVWALTVEIASHAHAVFSWGRCYLLLSCSSIGEELTI
jgi:hypothetical protein